MYELVIKHQTNKGVSLLTMKSYETTWNRFVGWFQKQSTDIDPWHATQRDLADFKRYLLKHGGRNQKPAAASTMQLTFTHLKAIFDVFKSEGIVPDNPVDDISKPKKARRTPKWLSRNEQNQLLRTVRAQGDLKELAIFTCFLNVGFRVHELCELLIEDIQITDRKGSVYIRGKGDKDREVPLNADVRNVIQRYLKDRQEQHQRKGEIDASKYLFTSQRSKGYTTRGMQFIVEKYRSKTNIKHLSCHALRHTFGHELVTADPPVRLEVVARLMGHFKENGDPNLDMTLIYTTASAEELENAVEGITWS